jgi:hypothetical protein
VPARPDSGSPADPPAGDSGRHTVASLAELYLGNILYALERCAISLDSDGDRDAAAYYRGLARELAEARGREKG